MVTMQDVANRANVSIATVSFVVNDTKPVTPQTRDRILQAIEELGYRRNAMARALASRRSRTIALIYPLMEPRNHHPFVAAATATAEEHGYHLVLWPIHGDNATAEIASLVQTGMADGVLLMEVQLDDERVNYLQRIKAPFALIGRTRELDGIDYVDIDFESSIETAVTQLAALGHRNLALIVENLDGTALADYSPPTRAMDTFRAALREQGLREQGLRGEIVRVSHETQDVIATADTLTAAVPEATAVIVMHDEVVLALFGALRHRGTRIPQDLSVVGIATSTATGRLLDPPLSAYITPGTSLGGLAAEALIARLEGSDAPPMQRLIPCTLFEGASMGPAPAQPLYVAPSA